MVPMDDTIGLWTQDWGGFLEMAMIIPEYTK
jgi:hypothetical protein